MPVFNETKARQPMARRTLAVALKGARMLIFPTIGR
jgi:hypothetical protein